MARSRRKGTIVPNFADLLSRSTLSREGLRVPDAEALRAAGILLQQYLEDQDKTVVGSLPYPHAETHLGGSDTIIGTNLPTPVVPGSAGSSGTPSSGAAAADHEHPMSEDLAALEDLAAVESELRDGVEMMPVWDPELNRLLSVILLLVQELVELEGE